MMAEEQHGNSREGGESSAKRANLSAAKQALLERRLRGKQAGTSKVEAIPRRDQQGPALLSFAQERLWFLDQLEPGSPAYNMPIAVRLKGPLDAAVLEQSLNEVARRHEALRATFIDSAGQPEQVIAQDSALTLRLVDLTDVPESEREAEAERLVSEQAGQPFDLARGPLILAALLRLGDEDHILLLVMHHIVSDGWSLGILTREIATLYGAFYRDQPSPLPELPIQYADFAAWQRQQLQGELLQRELSYWKGQLAGSSPLELPTTRPRPPTQTFAGASQSFLVSEELSQSLMALSRQEGATLFMLLLAAFQTLLYRYTGRYDIPIGTPVANRGRVEVEELVGFFVNTLVVRSDLSGGPGFREVLRRVKEVVLDAQAHQDVPFEMLVQQVQSERALNRNPLFNVMFMLQNSHMPAIELGGLSLQPLKVDSGTAKFDLELSMSAVGSRLSGSFTYKIDLFDASWTTQMVKHFLVLLRSIVTWPDMPVGELEILTEREKSLLEIVTDIPELEGSFSL